MAQEIGLWFDPAIRRADKYKPFVVGRKTKSQITSLRKNYIITKKQRWWHRWYEILLYKRADNDDNVSLAMGDMASSLVDIKELRAFIVEAKRSYYHGKNSFRY